MCRARFLIHLHAGHIQRYAAHHISRIAQQVRILIRRVRHRRAQRTHLYLEETEPLSALRSQTTGHQTNKANQQGIRHRILFIMTMGLHQNGAAHLYFTAYLHLFLICCLVAHHEQSPLVLSSCYVSNGLMFHL